MKLKHPRTVEKGGVAVPPPLNPRRRRHIDWSAGNVPTLQKKKKRLEGQERARKHDPRQGGENIRRFLNYQ